MKNREGRRTKHYHPESPHKTPITYPAGLEHSRWGGVRHPAGGRPPSLLIKVASVLQAIKRIHGGRVTERKKKKNSAWKYNLRACSVYVCEER